MFSKQRSTTCNCAGGIYSVTVFVTGIVIVLPKFDPVGTLLQAPPGFKPTEKYVNDFKQHGFTTPD
jgi:hypothetical protein